MKNKLPTLPYFDKAAFDPVIEQSVCTGERTAGFRERATGKITQVLLIKNEKDLKSFCAHYNLKKEEVRTIY